MTVDGGGIRWIVRRGGGSESHAGRCRGCPAVQATRTLRIPLSTLRPDSHSVRGELPPVSGESHPSKRATCAAVVRRSRGVPANPGAAFSRGRGPPPDSWTRLDVSACQRLADPRELTLASPRRLTRHILYRDGPAPILKAYRPSKAVQGSAPGGFSTRHPPNRELCPVGVTGVAS
jgi:hypothetical protein